MQNEANALVFLVLRNALYSTPNYGSGRECQSLLIGPNPRTALVLYPVPSVVMIGIRRLVRNVCYLQQTRLFNNGLLMAIVYFAKPRSEGVFRCSLLVGRSSVSEINRDIRLIGTTAMGRKISSTRGKSVE